MHLARGQFSQSLNTKININIEVGDNCDSALISGQNSIDETERFDFPRLNKFNHDAFDYYTAEKFNKLLQCNKYTNNSLKIIHLNIRGLEAHYDDLLLFLNTLDTSFDIITLSECHFSSKNTYLNNRRFSIDGYDNFFVFSSISYGGCAIYTKKELQANQITDLTSTSAYCDHLYVTFKTNKTKNTAIGVYYRHNLSAKADILEFINEFEYHMTHKKLKNSKIIISGDMNLDLLKISTNANIESYFNCLLANNLECHITKPTRIAYYKNSLQIRSATLIDHICSNILNTDCISGNFYYSDSDHFPNFVLFEDFFDNYEQINVKSDIYRRITSKIDTESLFNDMDNINWYNLVCNDEIDLDIAVNNLFDNLQSLCDKHAPKIKVSKRKMKYCNKPWIDSELVNLIRRKNDMYRKMKILPTLTNIILFKQMRNEVNHKIRYKKKMYFDNYFNMYKRNMKKSWEGIRYAMELSNNKKDIPNIMIDRYTGKSYTNPQNIVNQFAVYFESVPQIYRNNLTNKNTSLDSTLCYACSKPT